MAILNILNLYKRRKDMIKNYSFIHTSAQPDKSGIIYPHDIRIAIPEKVNVYFGELNQFHQMGDLDKMDVVGEGSCIKYVKNSVTADIYFDVKRFKKSLWSSYAACPLFKSVKLRRTDFGDEVVSCELIGLFLTQRPSIREIKKLQEK